MLYFQNSSVPCRTNFSVKGFTIPGNFLVLLAWFLFILTLNCDAEFLQSSCEEEEELGELSVLCMQLFKCALV